MFVSFQILQNDGLPDKLCKECTEKAFICYNFKVTIENSDATLRSVLFKEQTDDKKEAAAAFEGNNTTGYLMGIKTEIAFVDADPFIDDDGDFDETIDYADNSNTPNQQNDSYNNNSYPQEVVDEEDDAGDPDSEDDDSDENYDMKSPKEKAKNKLNQLMAPRIVENVDYIKDDEGKYVCQICNKKLVDKKGLNLHIRLHTGENLKRCHICQRGEILVSVSREFTNL
jgi:hypothetical protein